MRGVNDMISYEIMQGHLEWWVVGDFGLAGILALIIYIPACLLLFVPDWWQITQIRSVAVRAALIALAITPGIMFSPDGDIFLLFPLLPFALAAILSGGIVVLGFVFALSLPTLLPFALVWFLAKTILSRQMVGQQESQIFEIVNAEARQREKPGV
jgi:hypothetical protein